MSARVGALAKHRDYLQCDRRPEPSPQAVDEMLVAADRIERTAQEILALDAVLKRVDKNITAAAKRAVKRAGRWPLRLNSRGAKPSI